MGITWKINLFFLLSIFLQNDYALAFDDTCGCNDHILYDDYVEACHILQTQPENTTNNYKIIYHSDRGADVIDLSDTKLKCNSDILIFVGNPGSRNIDNKFIEGFMSGCHADDDELVFHLMWGLALDLDDCGDLQAAVINAGNYLVNVINQLVNNGGDIEDIRIVTLGSGFSVASIAANTIATSPTKDCLKYVAGVQPTETSLAVSSVSCKTIALIDNPGECASLMPRATVNIIFANSTCDEENPECLLSLPNLKKIVDIFNNNLPLYKCNSWQQALAGSSLNNRIKIPIEALSSGYYITNPICRNGTVNAKTIENRNNLIVTNTGPFDSFCGCSPFDRNAVNQFCSVLPNTQNTSALLQQSEYFLKLHQITSRCETLSVTECPALLTDQDTIIVVGDAIDVTATDYGNPANKNFYFSAYNYLGKSRNYISFYWTFRDSIPNCKELSRRIEEAGVYLSLYLRQFDSCNLDYSKQNFIAYGNGIKVLTIALSLLPNKVNSVIGIRPTNFPVTFGDYANQLVLFHQRPGQCSAWTSPASVSILVNDPALPCNGPTCSYGDSLVDFVYIAITTSFTVYSSDSWADAIAGISSDNTPLLITNLNITCGTYFTNLLNICPPANPGASNGKDNALINLNLNILNDLLD